METPFGDIDQLIHEITGEFEVGPRRIPIDLIEDESSFLLRADLPGFSREDIEVSLANQQLTIEAEQATETHEEDVRFIRQERTRRALSRTIKLPEPVDAEEVSARYGSGVLEIELPRQTPAAVHEIDVE